MANLLVLRQITGIMVSGWIRARRTLGKMTSSFRLPTGRLRRSLCPDSSIIKIAHVMENAVLSGAAKNAGEPGSGRRSFAAKRLPIPKPYTTNEALMKSINANSLTATLMAIQHRIDAIASLVNELNNKLTGKEITAELAETLKVFGARLSDFEKAYEADSDFDRVSISANHVGIYALRISQLITENLDDLDIVRIRDSITTATNELTASIAKRKVVYTPGANESTELPNDDASKNIRVLKRHNNELAIESKEQKRAIAANAIKLDELEGRLDTIISQVKEKLDQTNALYDSALVELNKKEIEIAELIGVASGNIISGSYEKSAIIEKKMADYLRYGSLFCMLAIVSVVGVSFFETTADSFILESSIFRLIFTISLSIPAAYLARESAKHRLQQYSHLQTSLDLKAITPYIASLPPADQHRLKSEIANRLFAAKNHDQLRQESYPLNIHEILVTLLNKLEFPSNKGNEATQKS
ncbi:MAG: hypothetical protein WAZ34_03030 [Rhodocyclaceae bacterium]